MVRSARGVGTRGGVRGPPVGRARGRQGPGPQRSRGSAPRYIEGTNGPDRLNGTSRAEQITGYLGADRIRGGGGDDDVDGREGRDDITTPPGPGRARLMGGPGDDRILARGDGPSVLHGSGGRDRLYSGPGGDRLDGGRGDDRIDDGSLGSDLIDAGPGDDVIRSAPRGMDRVRCGPGRDTVEADTADIVAADCERVTRPPPGELQAVQTLTGAPLGSTGLRRVGKAPGPLRLLWANGGYLYLTAPHRGPGGNRCLVTVEPSGASRARCGFGLRGALEVRRIAGVRYRWFALVPDWARTLRVRDRCVTVHDGAATFTAGRRLGPVVARGAAGRAVTVPAPPGSGAR